MKRKIVEIYDNKPKIKKAKYQNLMLISFHFLYVC
jgi:hypothetical protein